MKIVSARRLTSNAGLSILQVIVSSLLLLTLYRYLLVELGPQSVGLWSLILASTSIARMSDLGLTASVVKFVASYRAKQQPNLSAAAVETSLISISAFVAAGLVVAYPLLEIALRWAVPVEYQAEALKVLPWALIALWINCCAGILLAALDGCQHAGSRNILLIVGNAIFFVGAISFAPSHGVRGLALAQIVQATALLVMGWITLKFVLPTLGMFPVRWSKTLFGEMFTYSANFQVTALTAMLFDPLTKLLMGKFGGLGATAYYEMANQLVTKVRALLVSANQVMVPIVAEVAEKDPLSLPKLYKQSYETVFFAAVPIYVALVIALPLVSDIWIGHINWQFLTFANILVAAYFFNNLEVPAHFDNLGTGELKWNTIGQVTMSALNAVLGFGFGMVSGALGVAIGSGLSIVIGSAIVLAAVHRKYGLPLAAMAPSVHRDFALCVGVSGLLALCVVYAGLWNSYAPRLLGAFAVISCLAVTLVAAAMHPYRTALASAVCKRLL